MTCLSHSVSIVFTSQRLILLPEVYLSFSLNESASYPLAWSLSILQSQPFSFLFSCLKSIYPSVSTIQLLILLPEVSLSFTLNHSASYSHAWSLSILQSWSFSFYSLIWSLSFNCYSHCQNKTELNALFCMKTMGLPDWISQGKPLIYATIRWEK